MKTSTQNRIAAVAKEAKGATKHRWGKATHNTGQRIEGELERIEGKLQRVGAPRKRRVKRGHSAVASVVKPQPKEKL